MQKYVLDRNGNVVATFASDYNDKHTKTLQAGASTYEFTISKQDEAALFLETGNYVNFVDDVGKPWSFSILSYTETHNEKTVYCEDVGIELINKNVNAYKADAAYSFAFYFDMITKNTPWTIGINEINDLSRKLEWTSNDTGLSRLLSLLTEFDNAECKFNVKFAQNKPTEFKVDIYKQIGNPSTNVQIVYSNELNDITKTESRAEFVTAIQGEGGTPTKNADGTDIVTGTNPDGTTIETPKITFADIEYKDDNYVSAKGDNFLRAVTANKLFNPNSQDTYIEGYYSYDTESPQELLNRTLTQLKKYSTPQYTYEADVQVIDKNLDLGDTVKIIDHDYKPGLYLEARVASLEKSYTDPSKNTITFTNYKLINSSLAQKLADLQNIINSMPTASGISSIITNVINNSNVIEQKILALQSADGRSTVYYDAKPSNAKEGDTAFVKNPDSGNMEIWNYVGDKWNLTAGDATFDDVKKQIDKAQTDAQTAITTANTAVSTANDNAAKFGTDITNLKADVTKSVADVGAKADTAIDTANKALTQIGTANSDLTTIKSDMDTVKGTLETVATSEQLDGVNKTATSAQALAETNANSIKNTVTKTELTTAKSEWSSAQSTITAGQISTEITKVNQTITDATKDLVSQTVLNNAIVNSETGTKQVISKSIANISVGGRNLIPNSSTQQTLKRPEDNPSYPSWVGRPIYTGLKNNETYTFSALATAETTDKSAEQWGIRILGKSGYPQALANTLAANTGKRQSLTFTTPDDGISYDIWIYAGAMGQDYTPSNLKVVVTVLDYKLESGNKATDWSPAPEDQASVTAVNAIEQTVDGMKQTVANAVTQSQYTQLADQVTSTIAAVASGNLVADSGWTGDIGVTTHDFYTGTSPLYYIDNTATSETLERTCRSPYFAIKPNTTYTMSFKAFADVKVTNADVLLLTRSSGSAKDYNAVHPIINKRKFSPSTAEYVTVQVTTGASDNEGYIRFDNNGSTNGTLARLFFTEVQLEEGDIATPYKLSVSAAQSQITQTQSMIDARVEKNGVVNAINISPETILINGNKVHITGQTTIDSGIITNAMISNATIDSAKIKDGAITNAKIANLDGGKITANSITADKLAVNAFLVGLNNSMGQIQMQPNLITIETPYSRSTLGATGLTFGAKEDLTNLSSIYFKLMHRENGSDNFPTLGLSGNVQFDANIYGKTTLNAEQPHLHFENRNINGDGGVALVNDIGGGIYIMNSGAVWAGRSFSNLKLLN